MWPTIHGPDPPYWWQSINTGEGYTAIRGEVVLPEGVGDPVIVASDLLAYSAVNQPSDDVSLAGGAVSTTVRPVLTPLAANDDLEAVSSSASDVSVLTIVGRTPAGLLVTVPITLNGTSVVTDSTVLARVLSVSYPSNAIGSITLRRRGGGPLVATIPAGERGVSAMFKGAAGGASAILRYDKFFFKNVNGTETLGLSAVRLTADPSTKIRIGLAPSINDTATIANRRVAPAGIVFVDDNIDLSVPANLTPGAAIGVWVEMLVGGLEPSLGSTFTVSITGAS